MCCMRWCSHGHRTEICGTDLMKLYYFNNTLKFVTSMIYYKFVNSLRPRDAYMCHQMRPSLIQIKAWCQTIISTNAELLSIGPLQTHFSEILIKIQKFSLKKKYLKISYAKWWPYCLSLNVLNNGAIEIWYFFKNRMYMIRWVADHCRMWWRLSQWHIVKSWYFD